MRRAAVCAVATLAAACGDPHPTPRTTALPPPLPPVPAAAEPLARRAPPTCPLPAAKPPDPDDTRRPDAPGERREQSAHGDRCEVADSNLARVESAILAAHASAAPAPARAASKPWDRKHPPQFASLVGHRLALAPDEQQHLARDGFVVLPRMTFGSYATAFHEIYQSQLPVYISVDAVLHAIYAGNDAMLGELEDARVAPVLGKLLDDLGCAIAQNYPPLPAAQRRDLDVYLTVARALLSGDPPQGLSGDPTVDAEAAKLVAGATAAQEMTTVSLFGRDRVIDFTAYTPRGHYTATASRQRLFRASMWLSRLEFNLVSRGSRSSQPGTVPDRTETPREELDAVVLAHLATDTGRERAVLLDTAWSLLAGRREDIGPVDLAQLSEGAAVGMSHFTEPDAAAKVRTAIGDRFRRTTRMHYMPEGVTDLPAIATLLGPRVVPDATATRPLVHDELPGRGVLHAADLAYVLGHDRARDYLAADRAKFPALDGQLGKARALVAAAPRGSDDLYSAWFDAIVGLAEPPAGMRPSFMSTPAFADLRIDSALAAYGQLKHNFVLVAGEAYEAGGCDIPDGYVEPAPKTYAALVDYAARGERAMAILDHDDALGAGAYFKRLGTILRVLDEIGADELAGAALTADERAFLSMVAEMAPATTGSPPTYTGWWFDLFRSREQDGLAGAGYVASVFTGDTIAYVGVTAPRLGVFVVDTGGAPREVVGPVARAYEYQGPVAHRLDDAGGAALAEADRVAPWAASYSAAAGPPEPTLQLIYPAQDTAHRLDVSIETKTDLGPVTIELYDHHRVALATVTKVITAGTTYVHLPGKLLDRGEGIHLQVGAYHGWFDRGIVEGVTYATLGGYRSSP